MPRWFGAEFSLFIIFNVLSFTFIFNSFINVLENEYYKKIDNLHILSSDKGHVYKL